MGRAPASGGHKGEIVVHDDRGAFVRRDLDVETLAPGDQSPGLEAAMSAHVRSILLPRDPHHEFVRVMAHKTVETRTED